MIALEYDTTVDADGALRQGSTANFQVDLAKLPWERIKTTPVDPDCTSSGPPGHQFRHSNVPLVPRPSNDVQAVIGVHEQYAKGLPPLSVQTINLDAWIVCGAGDSIGYAQAPSPARPDRGDEGGRTAGQVVTTIVLLPFALALDVVTVAMCVMKVFFSPAGNTC
jgi:hypothetical protein